MLLIQSNMADRSPPSLRRRRMAGWKDDDPHGIPGYAGAQLTGRGLSLTEPLPADVADRLVFLAGARVITVSRVDGKGVRALDPDALGLCVGGDLPAPTRPPEQQEAAARPTPRALRPETPSAGALALEEAPSADFWPRAGRRALEEVRALAGEGAGAGEGTSVPEDPDVSAPPQEPAEVDAEVPAASQEDPEAGITTGLAAFVGGPPSVEERTRRLMELPVARLRSMLQEEDPGRRVIGVPKSQIVDQLVALGCGGDL